MPSPTELEPLTPDATATVPAPGLRSLLSFLIFLQLFVLFVAVASNFGPVSSLRRQLRAVPAIEPYLQLLHMDLAYNYQLTYGLELDTDHFVEIELASPNAEPGEKLMWPAEERFQGWQGQRYRNLTLRAAEIAAENEDFASLIPQAIAQQMLTEQGIDSGKHRLRLRRHLLLPRESFASADPAARDPYAEALYRNAYEADLTFFEGELILNKVVGAGEAAAVERDEE